MVGLLGSFTVAAVPKIIREGQFVVARVSQSEDPYLYLAQVLNKLVECRSKNKLCPRS